MNHEKSNREFNKPMKLHFHKYNGPVDQLIEQMIDIAGGIREKKMIREMIIAALKAGQEDENKSDLRLMNTTLKEMRFTARVFGPYRSVKKVTVFGSARAKPEDPAYQSAVRLGKKLKEAGYMVITGGGPGIMQAVNEGAGADYSFGVNIRLPFEQQTNPVLMGNPKTIVYKYFFNRKVAFIREAHAVVLYPGGFGTLDEAMEVLMLVQTGKRNLIPLVMVEPPGSTYWAQWLDFLRTELLNRGMINPTDFYLMRKVDSVQEAVSEIDEFYFRYHSLRYVGDKLVIRLNSPLSGERIKQLQSEFQDILVLGGQIASSPPLPGEGGRDDLSDLPRLVLDFDKRQFGRLRQFINAVNERSAPDEIVTSFPFRCSRRNSRQKTAGFP